LRQFRVDNKPVGAELLTFKQDVRIDPNTPDISEHFICRRDGEPFFAGDNRTDLPIANPGRRPAFDG